MRNILLLISVFIITTAVAQSKQTAEIKILRNEKWWGICVGNDIPQPFTKNFCADTNECSSEYFTISMMVSSEGRYVWSAYPMSVDFDGNTIKLTSEFEKPEVRKGGHTLREAYMVCCHTHMKPEKARFNRELFSKPVYDAGVIPGIIPSQETILKCASEILYAGLSPGTIIIPDGWRSMSCETDFSAELYPDPTGMLKTLHDKGFKVAVTITPYVYAAGKTFLQKRGEGALLPDIRKNPLIFEARHGFAACLDLSSRETSLALKETIKSIQAKYDIDGFLFDYSDVLDYLREDSDRLLKFTENWDEIGRETNTPIYSPAFNVTQTTCVNWMRERGELSWDNMAAAVSQTINAGLTGYIYTYVSPGWTAGKDFDEELLLRAMQLALMMPVTVLPPSSDAIQNPKYRKALERTIKRNISLKEYFASLIDESSNTAEPLVRHMEYQFPKQGFANCSDQFMLGPKYLVAPVLGKGEQRTVRLPRGVWIAEDGTKYKGPRVVSVDVTDGKTAFFTLSGK